MTKKTLVIAGAGPGLGLAIARRFGREGFQVALIARRREALDRLVGHLAAEGITAAGFVADIGEEPALVSAFSAIRERFGAIDVLEFSPTPKPPSDFNRYLALYADRAIVEHEHKMSVLGAVTCVRQVLPDMTARRDGAILLTTSGSACTPMQVYTPIGMSQTAVRNYAYCLHEALAGTGVYAGTVCISVLIRKGEVGDPDRLADIYYALHVKRDRVEEIVSSGVHPNELHNRDMDERQLGWARANSPTSRDNP